MALAKNLATPHARAHQNHLLRTIRARRILSFRFPFCEPVTPARVGAGNSRKEFVAQGAVYAALRTLLPPHWPGRLLEAKLLRISTYIARYLQVSRNQHLRISRWNSIRMNTCRKREGGGGWVGGLDSSTVSRFGVHDRCRDKTDRRRTRSQDVNNGPAGLSKKGTDLPFDSPLNFMKIKTIVYIDGSRAGYFLAPPSASEPGGNGRTRRTNNSFRPVNGHESRRV